MIDDHHRLVFVENPKTATFAVKCALRGHDHFKAPGVRVSSINHDTPRLIKSKHPEEWSSYMTFVVVRNTWDRAHSFFDFYRRIADSESYQAISFDQWVAAGCPPPDEDHLRAPMWGEGRIDDVLCQLRYCQDVDEIIVLRSLDHRCRRRELIEGLARVCRRAGIDPPPIPVDKNNHGRSDQPVIWKRATAQRLLNVYEEEIERFGFEMPAPVD